MADRMMAEIATAELQEHPAYDLAVLHAVDTLLAFTEATYGPRWKAAGLDLNRPLRRAMLRALVALDLRGFRSDDPLDPSPGFGTATTEFGRQLVAYRGVPITVSEGPTLVAVRVERLPGPERD